jgi:3-hydroxyisobutyrate dehydrogenase
MLSPTVGVIGLGQMGRGIAKNLDRVGMLRGVWDIAPAAREIPLSLAVKFEGGRGMAERCDIILLALPTSREILANLTGDDGVLGVERKSQILVDLTTSHPSKTKQLIALARAAGRDYLDCGMTGGAIGADAGTLALMIGGERETFERARPVLEAFTKKLFLVGPSGAGHTLKLIHNMIVHTIFIATSEGCRMAQKAGIDLATVIDVLNAGNARSFVSESRFPKHILSGKFDGRSHVSNLAKDLAMAAEFADEHGEPAPYTHLTAGLLARAMEAGLADQDFTTLYNHLEDLMRTHMAYSRTAR